jgi:arabinose-5-phosphate isomerase
VKRTSTTPLPPSADAAPETGTVAADVEIARRVLRIEAAAVAALADRLGESFHRAVEICASSTGRAVVTGIGKSGLIARKIASTLTSTGTPALFLHAAEGLHGDIGVMTRGDCLIAVSNSGTTSEVLSLIPPARRLALPVIALTGEPSSSLGRSADVVLDVSVAEEACPLGLAPTASTTAMLALGDALAITLLERRGFRAEDFGHLHPAGAIGRRLRRVDELMRTGAAIPIVPADTSLRHVIAEISAKNLGVTGVVDEGGALRGVITDGDLRRAIEAHGDLRELRAGEIMSRRPKTVAADAVAESALARMEEHAITSLFIVDAEGRPCGVLHLHDLLRAGVV